jgi:RNA-directed DNA polymerase
MIDIIDKISSDLNVPLNMLRDALSNARDQVRHIKIPKRDGSERRVYQPSKKLKTIQYWLLHNIFRELKVHSSSVAFLEGKSIKTNALLHNKGRYFLKLDFKDFFPSIHFNDLKPIIACWHTETNSPLDPDSLLEAIRLSCFYKGDFLPIGYPTSPIISNVVMYEFDLSINTLLAHNVEVLGNVVYTRYADDLVFSTLQKGVCGVIHNLVASTLSSLKSPSLTINTAKTRFVSSSSGSAIVTGLRVCYDGHITLHRKYKDKARLLISLFDKGMLHRDDIPALKGHLAYIKHADSRFYTKLHRKYFQTISILFSI